VLLNFVLDAASITCPIQCPSVQFGTVFLYVLLVICFAQPLRKGDRMNLMITDTAIELGIFALDLEFENGMLDIYPAVSISLSFEMSCTAAA
jgi:hypothetical protein